MSNISKLDTKKFPMKVESGYFYFHLNTGVYNIDKLENVDKMFVLNSINSVVNFLSIDNVTVENIFISNCFEDSVRVRILAYCKVPITMFSTHYKLIYNTHESYHCNYVLDTKDLYTILIQTFINSPSNNIRYLKNNGLLSNYFINLLNAYPDIRYLYSISIQYSSFNESCNNMILFSINSYLAQVCLNKVRI